MAHLIDQTKKSEGAFVAYKKPAWHGLGTIFDREMTFPEVLEFSGLDYEVVKSPNRHLVTAEDGSTLIDLTSDSSFFTYRTDTKQIMGNTLGAGYHVLQNRDALAVADQMVKDSNGTLRYETAGALDEGRMAWVLLAFQNPLEIGKDDLVNRYLLIATSHNGRMSLQARLTPVRVVCNNTLQQSVMRQGNAIMIRHTAGAVNQLAEAARLLSQADIQTEQMEITYKQLREKRIEETGFINIVAESMLSERQKKSLLSGEDMDKVLDSRARQMLKDVFNYAHDGVGQEMAGPGTAWWAYNAITGFVSNCKAYKSPEQRMNSMIFSSSADTMTKALDLCMTAKERKRVDHKLIGSFKELINN